MLICLELLEMDVFFKVFERLTDFEKSFVRRRQLKLIDIARDVRHFLKSQIGTCGLGLRESIKRR